MPNENTSDAMNNQENEKVPLFKSWNQWYAAVIIVLLALILFFYLLTKHFS